MTVEEWLGAFVDEIGVAAPSKEDMDEILRLASVAAHASERIAAPIACYLAGLSGRSLGETRAAAEGVSAESRR
jgi:Domain of unknown function (DUF6457)